MKLNSHHISPWITLLFTCWTSPISASTLYHTGASPNAQYHSGASSNAALYHSAVAPNLYPSYYASAYPSYFAPSYPQARYLWPSFARVPVAPIPAAIPAVAAAIPAVPAAIPAVPAAVPAYKYVTVIPQNIPPHGYSFSYFRKHLTTIPAAVPAISAAVPAIPAAVPAIPAAVPAAVIPRPTLYAGLYPHLHQGAVLPHVHQRAVLPHVHQGAVLPHVHPVGPYFGAAGPLHPQAQPAYQYRAAAAADC